MTTHHPPRRMGRRRLLLAATAALTLALAAVIRIGVSTRMLHAPIAVRQGTTPRAPAAAGRPAPDFTLPLFTGGTLSLRSLRGKPVVLNFWASWCAPCREETPLLVRLHGLYGPRIVFVGVNVEDDNQDARRFLAQYHVDYPAVRSSDQTMITAYKIIGLPTTVFVSAHGVIVDQYAGGFVGPNGEQALRQRLDRLLEPATR